MNWFRYTLIYGIMLTYPVFESFASTVNIDHQRIFKYAAPVKRSTAPTLVLAVKCKKGTKLNLKTKKCAPTLSSLGSKFFSTSCAMSGCHGGQDTSRFIGLTPEALDIARANILQMQFLTISPKDLKNLFAYIKTLQ